MKKSYISLIFALPLFVLSSCTDAPVNGSVTGLVKELTDSVLVVEIDGSEKTLDVIGAQFTNGAVMAGDSVALKCVNNKVERIHLMPQVSQEISADELKDNELLTRPATDKEVKDMEEYVEKAKKYQSQE